jgi:hypothetical protein
MPALLELPVASKHTTVKIESQVASDAKIAAEASGKSLAQYLSDALRPIVEQDINEWFERRASGRPAQHGPTSKRKAGGK